MPLLFHLVWSLKQRKIINFVLVWVQLPLMPLPCIPKKWRIWLQNLALLSSNCGTKWLLQEIISPGKKMSTQRYIGNDEVRNLRITSSPKIHGLFHSSTDGISHFLQWSVMTLTPLVCIYRSVMCQPQQVQPQTKWAFLQETVCFYSDHALMWT